MHHFPINEAVFKYKLTKEELQKTKVLGLKSISSSQLPRETSTNRARKHKESKCDLCDKSMRADALARHRGKRECVKLQKLN
jgi:hypothetical protein